MLLDIFLKCYVFIIFLKTTLLRYNLHILAFICVECVSPRFLGIYAELHGHHYNLVILHFLYALQGSLWSLWGHCHSHFCPPPLFWHTRHCALSRPHGETEVSTARKRWSWGLTHVLRDPRLHQLTETVWGDGESSFTEPRPAKGIVTFRLQSTESSCGGGVNKFTKSLQLSQGLTLMTR